MKKPKKRVGYEWSLDDDLAARDKSDWELPKPPKTKPKKRKPVAKRKPISAKPKAAPADAGRKSPNLAAAQARSAAIRKDPRENARRDQLMAERLEKKEIGKKAARKFASAKKIIAVGKSVPKTKLSAPGRKTLGTMAARQNARALGLIGRKSPYAMELASRWTRPGATKRELYRNAGLEQQDRMAEAYDYRGAKKQRGAKPSPSQIKNQRRQMVASRGKKLTGIIPVVATLASGWLSGELNKKGKK